ncbi:MAG: glycosyl transferase [Eubacterium sp.]|nr:glycosyl transferase [Eubacterium sp.]
MSIPKIIHYCWFGQGPIPKKEQNCIDTWQKHFPDYEIKRWDESNFDFESCKFAKQAYDAKKYAFVSDYARAKILFEHGGLYMDTDVEVLKDFPQTDEPNGYVGFERRHFVGTAVMASVPKNPIVKKLLDYYETHDYIQKDGSFDNIANVSILTDILVENGLVLGGERQKAAGFEIFNREFFYPKKLSEDEFRIEDETCCIHRCSNSWMTERERKRGNSKVWIAVGRPVLRTSRKLILKIAGKEKTRDIEIKLRNKMK